MTKSRDLRGLDVIGALPALATSYVPPPAPRTTTTKATVPPPAPTYTKVITVPPPAPPYAKATVTPTAPPGMLSTFLPPPVLPRYEPVVTPVVAPTRSYDAAVVHSRTAPVTAVKTTPVPSPAESAKTSTAAAQKRAADAAKAQKAQDEAKNKAKSTIEQEAERLSQKLAATARKLTRRFPREAGKLSSAAGAVKRKASTKVKGDPFAAIVGEMFGRHLVGLSDSVLQAVTDWIGPYAASVNAAALAGDVLAAVAPLVDQLTQAGERQVAITGQSIVRRCQDVISQFDPDRDPPDTSLGQTVTVLQSDASAWMAQAQAALEASFTGGQAVLEQAKALLADVQGVVQELQGAGLTSIAQTGQIIIGQLQGLLANPTDPANATKYAQIEGSTAQFKQLAAEALAQAQAAGAAGGGGGSDAGAGGGGGGGGAPEGGAQGEQGSEGAEQGAPAPAERGGGGGYGGGEDGGEGGGEDGEEPEYEDTEPGAGTEESEEEMTDEATEEAAEDEGGGEGEKDPFAAIVGELTVAQAGQSYTDRDTVIAVQSALKTKGFDPGPVDGQIGPKTQKAIRFMQAALKVPETGLIDEGVLMALKIPAPARKGTPGSTGTQMSPSGQKGGAAAGKSSWLDFFQKPLWTGSQAKVWHAFTGAGVAVALATVLLIVFGKKRRK